ncbi:hypothetical protein ATANTOWER_004401 [Ataeniobius toweri]|uniref:Uncharacterized protein n=1 Tax=Ataeniobius toweri TaxID=208326 RepID=A0ABU7ADZ4_9TELE|nr:hypothetical protein [Ataeniobius toweri]
MPGRFLISSGAAALNQTDKRKEALPSLSNAGIGFFLSPLLPCAFFAPLSTVAVFPRSFGEAPASLPFRLNLPIHPDRRFAADPRPSNPFTPTFSFPSPTPSKPAKVAQQLHCMFNCELNFKDS